MANHRNLKQDSELSLCRPLRDAPPPATATLEEVLGATSPSTADCENCSDRGTEHHKVPHFQVISLANPGALGNGCTGQGGRTASVSVAQDYLPWCLVIQHVVLHKAKAVPM